MPPKTKATTRKQVTVSDKLCEFAKAGLNYNSKGGISVLVAYEPTEFESQEEIGYIDCPQRIKTSTPSRVPAAGDAVYYQTLFVTPSPSRVQVAGTGRLLKIHNCQMKPMHFNTFLLKVSYRQMKPVNVNRFLQKA